MAKGKSNDNDKPNVTVKQGEAVTRAKNPPKDEGDERVTCSVEQDELGSTGDRRVKSYVLPGSSMDEGRATRSALPSPGSLYWESPPSDTRDANQTGEDWNSNAHENSTDLVKIQLKRVVRRDCKPFTRGALNVRRTNAKWIVAEEAAANATATAPTGNMQFFRIDDSEAVTMYMMEKLFLLQQQTCKKLAKCWIKLICPKKQAKFPYRKKGEGVGITPGWWCFECQFKEPDHISKPERVILIIHFLRLRATRKQLQEWNGDTNGDKTEPYKILLTRGWTAFLQELTPASLIEDSNDEPKHKVARRNKVLEDLFMVAKMEEEYLDGARGKSGACHDAANQPANILPPPDGSDTFAWDRDAALKEIKSGEKATHKAGKRALQSTPVSDTFSTSISPNDTSTPPTELSSPTETTTTSSIDNSTTSKKRKRCAQEDMGSQKALILRRPVMKAERNSTSTVSHVSRMLKASQSPPVHIYNIPRTMPHKTSPLAGPPMTISFGSVDYNGFDHFTDPYNVAAGLLPPTAWSMLPPPQPTTISAYSVRECSEAQVEALPSYGMPPHFPRLLGATMFAPNPPMANNAGAAWPEKYDQPSGFVDHNFEAPPPQQYHTGMNVAAETPASNGQLDHNAQVQPPQQYHRGMHVAPARHNYIGQFDHNNTQAQPPQQYNPGMIMAANVHTPHEYFGGNTQVLPPQQYTSATNMPGDMHPPAAGEQVAYADDALQRYQPQVPFRYPDHRPAIFFPPDSLNGPMDRGFTGHGSGIGDGAWT